MEASNANGEAGRRNAGDELGRAPKRRRTSAHRNGDGYCDATGASSDHGESALSLPPEVWASAMNYLDYRSVIACGVASKRILHDALPLVTSLHVDEASQLNGLAWLFRDLREICVSSLVLPREGSAPDEEGFADMSVDDDTVLMTQFFLLTSRLGFGKLERISLGGGDSGTGEMFGFDEYHHIFDDQDEESVKHLIDQISQAYQRNFLPRNLVVLGLRCPDSHREDADAAGCTCCELACQTWPIEHVVNFHDEGSSARRKWQLFESKRLHSLDVCLAREQIEDIVESRPGGPDLLRSESRLLHLLGQGCRYVIRSDENAPLYVVHFFQDQIDEMRRTIETANLDVKKLTREGVFDALRTSFASAIGSNHIHPKSRCHIPALSLYQLEVVLGLPISVEDRVDWLQPKSQHLPHVMKVLNSGVGSVSAIHVICVSWLARALENSRGSLIQRVIDFGVLPLLTGYLSSQDTWTVQSAVQAIDKIARYGSTTHTTALVEWGVVPKLVSLLDPSNKETAQAAAATLGRIADQSATCRDFVLQANVVEPLLLLLNESSETPTLRRVSYAISTLCGKNPKPEFSLLRPFLVPISRLLMKDDENVLANSCLVLLDLFGSEVIDLGVYPRFVQLLAYPSEDVQLPALVAVKRHVQRDKILIEPLIGDEVLSRLTSFMSSPIPGVQLRASQIMCKISTGGELQIRAIVSQGCVRSFCGLIISSSANKVVRLGLKGLFNVLLFGRTKSTQNVICTEIRNALCDEIQCIDAKLAELENGNDNSGMPCEEQIKDLRKEVDEWKVPQKEAPPQCSNSGIVSFP